MVPAPYSRCLSCRSRLGANRLFEAAPVGRQLAFDPWKGRLWIVCTACRNWNLAPLDDRWTAVEEAERLFETATIGASTEHIALGRVEEGSELIRIGRAGLTELAGWRYGRRLRRRSHISVGVGGLTAGGAAIVGAMTGIGLTPAALGGVVGFAAMIQLYGSIPAMTTGDGRTIRFGDARTARLLPADVEAGWRLIIPRLRSEITLEGSDAFRALRKLLPRANLHGGDPREVAEAAAELTNAGSADQLIRATATNLKHGWNTDPTHHPFVIGNWGPARPHRIATATPRLRLALEMAANDDFESRALEGELTALLREWREAEELASISDELLLPASVRSWMQRHGRNPGPA